MGYTRWTRIVPSYDVAQFEDWPIIMILNHFLVDEKEMYDRDPVTARGTIKRAILWSREFKAIEAGGRVGASQVYPPNPYKGEKETLV